MDRRSWHDSLAGEEVGGAGGGGTSTKSGCSKKKKKMSVVIHVRSSLSGRKEGRDRRIDDRRAERKIIHVHSCIRFPVPGAGGKKEKKKKSV